MVNMKNVKQRLGKEQWATHGLKTLGQKGVGSLRIDELCHRLKVTKGSFYWHFKGRADFLNAVLEHWKRIATFDIIDRIEAKGGLPQDKILALFDESNSGVVDFSAEQAIRHWAKTNKQAAQAVLYIDDQRMKFLIPQFRAMEFSKSEAETRTRLLYSLIISEAIIYQKEKPAKRRQRQRQCFDTIVFPA
tara:strand:+ start:8138 stop:8707 length:570 start_codon:yes stop_codon:yes gene_type:complete